MTACPGAEGGRYSQTPTIASQAFGLVWAASTPAAQATAAKTCPAKTSLTCAPLFERIASLGANIPPPSHPGRTKLGGKMSRDRLASAAGNALSFQRYFESLTKYSSRDESPYMSNHAHGTRRALMQRTICRAGMRAAALAVSMLVAPCG